MQSKAACWALVTKLLCTIFKKVHKIRHFASEAVSLGADSLQTNGMFLYAAVEELQVLRELEASDWHNHPKFTQNVVLHLFETCLPRAVYKQNSLTGGTTPASNHLKIMALGVCVDQCVSALGLAKKNKGGKGLETID